MTPLPYDGWASSKAEMDILPPSVSAVANVEMDIFLQLPWTSASFAVLFAPSCCLEVWHSQNKLTELTPVWLRTLRPIRPRIDGSNGSTKPSSTTYAQQIGRLRASRIQSLAVGSTKFRFSSITGRQEMPIMILPSFFFYT